MEQVEDRVLGYKLAKEIDISDFDEISGGSVQPSVQVTGTPSCPDGAADVQLDW